MRFAPLRAMVAFFQPYMTEPVRKALITWAIRLGLVAVAFLSIYELMFGQ